MRNFIHLKFFYWVLIVVMLTVTADGVRGNAYAMESHVAAGDEASYTETSASHQCPCSPVEQHNDYDGCETCVNCACHAPLTIQPFKLSYNPSILDLQTFDPFKFLPEVYLSKFIPPQKQA